MPLPQSKATVDADASKTTVVTEDDYEARLEEWESIQSKILSWLINTFIPFIHSLLPHLGTTASFRLLRYFYLIATIALMIQIWSSTLNPSFIRCANRHVSLFLIIILRLFLCGNNSLLQILH